MTRRSGTDNEGPTERSTRRVQRPDVRAIGRILNDMEVLGAGALRYLAGAFEDRAADIDDRATLPGKTPANDSTDHDPPSPVE